MDVTAERYERARKRVRELKAFYVHLVAYAAVILVLFAINATGTDAEQGNWWVLYPALGWGVAVAIHAVLVVTGGLSSWEDRKVQQLLRREERQPAA